MNWEENILNIKLDLKHQNKYESLKKFENIERKISDIAR